MVSDREQNSQTKRKFSIGHLLEMSRAPDGALLATHSHANPSGSIFGGVLIAQLLQAAGLGVETEASPHHLQLTFISAGSLEQPMRYEVRRLLNGRSFIIEQVLGWQGDRVIVSGQVAFHRPEQGPRFAQPFPENIDPPENLPSLEDLAWKHADKLGASAHRLSKGGLLEFRLPDEGAMLFERKADARIYYWVRSREKLPDDGRLHACALGYLSDYWFPITALMPHLQLKVNHGLKLSSLNHAIWFHGPVRADEWLLVDAQSPASGGARGLSFGNVYTREGVLVASLAQENLFRGWISRNGELVAPHPASQV